MPYLFLPLLLSFMLIGGCSDNKVEDHVLKEKMDTIEKAKEVEELIQNTVQQTKQNIDEQSERGFDGFTYGLYIIGRDEKI